jgi:hypothetical protein
MPEGVLTAEGKPLDLDAAKAATEREFAAAMAAPAGDDKAPPRRAPRPTAPEDEKPRVKRGRPPGSGTKQAKDQRQSPAALSRDEKVRGIAGLVQLGAGGCLVAERATGSTSFRADAITLASSAGDIAEAVVQTAEVDERFARVVDKVCSVGPYGALIQVAFTVGMQIARNHGAQIPGTQDPSDLIQMAEQSEVSVPAAA